VERYEEGGSPVCGTLPYLPSGQSKTSETNRDASAVNYSGMEVGTHSHGFCHGFPRIMTGLDAVWVVVDCLTKLAHFIPIKTTYDMSRLAKKYVDGIVRLHGVPRSVILDCDPRFTSQFWQSLQVAMGTKLNFSTAFHPQTEG